MTVTHEIVVPKEDSDDELLVTKLYFSNNDEIKEKDVLIELETSKSAMVIDAPHDGYVEYLVEKGSVINVGEPILRIHDSEMSNFDEVMESNAPENDHVDLRRKFISRDAEKYLREKRLSVPTIDKQFVTLADVAINRTPTSADSNVNQVDLTRSLDGVAMNRAQRQVMSTVLRAKAEQAPAFIFGEARVDASLAFLDKASDEGGHVSTLTLNDLIIKLASNNLKEFPRLNSTLSDGLTIVEHADCHIGTAVEVEGRLFMVSIENVDKLTLPEIASRRLNAILNIMRGEPCAALSAQTTFSVTVLKETSTINQVPIIYPGHAAILGMGGVRQEIRPDSNGSPTISEDSWALFGL